MIGVNYKRIGDFIQLVDKRNTNLAVTTLLGLSISKEFIPSVANTIGADMARYKIIRKNQFACSLMQVRRDKKMPVALQKEFDVAIISQAYPVFKVVDENLLLPEYLMMWMSRTEFDRHACFLAVGGVRGSLEWEDFLEMHIPVPSINKQREIVKEYNIIVNRIKLNEKLNQKLIETAQAIYKHWFVDFEFPDENGNPYKSSGGEMVWNEELGKEIPEGWEVIQLSELVDPQTPISYGVVKPGDEDPDGVKFIRSGDINNGQILFNQLRTITQEVSHQYKRTLIKGQEILMSIVGNPGQVAIAPNILKEANIARQVAIIRILDESQTLYIKHYLTSNIGQSMLKDIILGSVQEVINLSDLRMLSVLYPKIELINSYFNYSGKIQKCINQNVEEIELSKHFKELILSKMTKVETTKTP